MAPPDRPVPAPRATTGAPIAWQALSTACTCASDSGSATTSGPLAVGGQAVAFIGRRLFLVPDEAVGGQHRLQGGHDLGLALGALEDVGIGGGVHGDTLGAPAARGHEEFSREG
jgi:hypothetical protein